MVSSDTRYRLRIRVWQPNVGPVVDPTEPNFPVQAHLKLRSVVSRRYTRPPQNIVSIDPPEVTTAPTNVFDMSAFTDYDVAFRILSRSLNFLSIPSNLHSTIVDYLFRHGQRAATCQSNVGRRWVPMAAVIGLEMFHRLGDHSDGDDRYSVERALAESAAAAGDGMVPAAAAAVKKMLKRVRVEDAEDNEDGEMKRGSRRRRSKNDEAAMSCAICMEDIPEGSTAAEMPCSHLFHEKCIRRWLEESHYCPMCRFELPTTSASTSTAC